MVACKLGQSVRRHYVVVHIPRRAESRGYTYDVTARKWVAGRCEPKSRDKTENERHVERFREVLDDHHVEEAYWCKVRCAKRGESLCAAEEYHRVEFVVEMGAKLEGILLSLRKQQFGIAVGDISVVSTTLSYTPQMGTLSDGDNSTSSQELHPATSGSETQASSFRGMDESGAVQPGLIRQSLSHFRRSLPFALRKSQDSCREKKMRHGTQRKSLFSQSVKSRIVVEELLAPIKEGSEFTFDFLMLLMVASILAGVGLITDNTVVIVASMLVSPIMGPVLGVTFGYTVHRYDILLTGLRTELLSLLICVFTGVLIGAGAHPFTCTVAEQQTSLAAMEKPGNPVAASDLAISDHCYMVWPTEEMQARGMWQGLAPGTVIALVSGVGVAISVCNRNANSLVGVAISASLLPPAVNCGICWAHALFGQLDLDTLAESEFVRLGGVSFLLTLLNIVIIVLVALFMFLVKRVHWGRKLWGWKERNEERKGRISGASNNSRCDNGGHNKRTDPFLRHRGNRRAGLQGRDREATFWQEHIMEYRNYNDKLNAKSIAKTRKNQQEHVLARKSSSMVCSSGMSTVSGRDDYTPKSSEIPESTLTRLPSPRSPSPGGAARKSLGGLRESMRASLSAARSSLRLSAVTNVFDLARDQASRPSVFEMLEHFEDEERELRTVERLHMARISKADDETDFDWQGEEEHDQHRDRVKSDDQSVLEQAV